MVNNFCVRVPLGWGLDAYFGGFDRNNLFFRCQWCSNYADQFGNSWIVACWIQNSHSRSGRSVASTIQLHFDQSDCRAALQCAGFCGQPTWLLPSTDFNSPQVGSSYSKTLKSYKRHPLCCIKSITGSHLLKAQKWWRRNRLSVPNWVGYKTWFWQPRQFASWLILPSLSQEWPRMRALHTSNIRLGERSKLFCSSLCV